ncbi:hypothetical protein HMF7854_04300 [Sphingomonas ginkgonis]|uniref:Uncharacterized protein n=1 Tax=Sphingomonas ginkgonis TaxID=2315330 RepID=A0A3S0EL53_9SPHN|nr:hypothetical protein [Sphingomonas ginkgonis]RST30131.1 hypothetical protein HMF7854_04300 [Sphingomonas ginkgonis]
MTQKHETLPSEAMIEAMADAMQEIAGPDARPWPKESAATTIKLKALLVAIWQAAEATRPPSSPTGDEVSPVEEAHRFWLVFQEPGCVPNRKGPWPVSRLAETLREAMKARLTSYIHVLTVDEQGVPHVEHGPEVLQMLDGRSMSTGRKHNARVREAETIRQQQSDSLKAGS